MFFDSSDSMSILYTYYDSIERKRKDGSRRQKKRACDKRFFLEWKERVQHHRYEDSSSFLNFS